MREQFRDLAAKGELPRGTNLSIVDRLRFGYFRARHLLRDEQRLAESLGKSTKQIRRYVEGDDFPFGFLQKMSDVTGIPVSWFAGAEDASSGRLHLNYLSEALAIVEEWLDENDRQMKPAKKADVVAQIYQFIVEDIEEGRAPMDKNRARQILRLVA